MANSELLYNIVYRIDGEDAIQKSINYVNSLTGDFKLLEQEIKKSGNVMGRQSKALVDNASQIQSVINRQERLRSGLKRTDAEYVKLTNSINRGKQALTQIDQVQSKYNSTTRKAQSLYNATITGLSSLSMAYRDLQSQARANSGTDEQSIQRAKELKVESTKLKDTLAQLETEVEILGRKSGLSAEQMNKLKGALIQARNNSVSAGRAVQGISSAFTGTTKVNASANQLLLSFGDIAQDSAQFSYGFAQGARAIGNNIAFASEQVLILRQKMLESGQATAGFSGVMKTLGAQLMGPVGVIFAINTAVTAITMLATFQERAKKKTEDATDAFREQAEALLAVTQQFGFEGDFRFFELTNLLEAKESLSLIDAQIKALEISTSVYNKQLLYSYLNQGAYADEIQKTVERQNVYKQVIADNAAATSVLRNEQDRLNQEYVLLSSLSPEAREELKKLSDEYKAQQELIELSRKQLRLTAQGGNEYLDVIDNVKRITKELEIAEAERALGLETTGITEEEARKQLELLRDSLDKGTMSADLYNDAVLKVAAAYPSLTKEAKKATDETGRLQRNLQAAAEIRLFGAERAGDPAAVRDARLEILRQRAIDEELTENEITLEKLKINSEYYDELTRQEEESQKERLDLEKKAEKERQLILKFRTQAFRRDRESESSINEYYNNKLAEEQQRLRDDDITNQEVFNELSISIEAQRQQALNKLIRDGANWRKDIELETTKSIISGMFGLLSAAFKDNKAFAIAETLVSTYFAAQKAYQSVMSSPQALALGVGAEPLARRAAAGAVLQGLARVAAIKSTNIGSESASGGGSNSSGQGISITSNQASSVRSFAAPIAQAEPEYRPTRGKYQAPIYINNELNADNEKLYILTKAGERKLKSKQL